jgi:predicted negative regulator of RcsB-dependent stress response
MLLRPLALTTLALLAASAGAQVLKDPQWQAWLDAGRSAELARAAQARPADDESAIALALAAVDDGDAARIAAAVPALQACVDQRPQAACAYALGRVYGQQAMTASVFKMPGLAAKTKEQFLRAVELDPQLYEARSGLAQYYLMAPGFAGGSVPKARELAATAPRPEQGQLVRFLVAAHEKDWAAAEKEVAGLKAGDDRMLQRELRNARMRLGTEFIDQKAHAKARAQFEAVQREHPRHAAGPYGLARVALETQQPDEALRLLEACRTLEAAERYPLDYRIGQALIAKGDKAGARQALERFVQNKRAHPRSLEDARRLLAGLA